jgi:Mitochondrial carrier protein
MDNVKTKLQTQSIKSSCDKFEQINQDFEKKMNSSKNTEFSNMSENTRKIQRKNKISAKDLNFSSQKDCMEPEIKYKNIFSTVKQVYREHGFFNGFFRGLTPRILSNSPSCAISWGTYEIVKHLMLTKISGHKRNSIN